MPTLKLLFNNNNVNVTILQLETHHEIWNQKSLAVNFFLVFKFYIGLIGYLAFYCSY